MIFPSREFEDAIGAVCSGTAAEGQARALGALLREDRAAREAYLWRVELHARLATEEALFAVRETKVLTPQQATTPTRRRPALVRNMIASAAAACVTLAALVMWAQRTPPVQVEVTAESGAAGFTLGQRLALREVRLPRGTLRLRLESGVLLDCAGPFIARFDSPTRLRLSEGRLSVDVGERGFGFTVVTAGGEVVDLGTAFGVEALPDGRSSVAVFSGKVELRQSASATVALQEGEGLRFAEKEVPSRLQSVQVAQSDGSTTRLEPSRPPQPMISEVSDNLTETNRYYGIVMGGMKPQQRAFADRILPEWKAMPGEAFPAELIGADLIQTFQEERWRHKLNLRIAVSRPAAVYVMHDPRSPPPAWLQARFVKTGLRLRSGPWLAANITRGLTPDADGRFHIPCEVWKLELTEASSLSLGMPFEPKSPSQSAMYGIAVKEGVPP